MAPKHCDPAATSLAQSRRDLLAGYRPGQDSPAELREGLTGLYEGWIGQRARELGIGPGSGLAVVAVGALGRREPVGYSDLDLILLHDDGRAAGVAETADGLWYPIWDAGVGLDHSVRTLAQALRVARSDITAALGLLDARHIVGDKDLSTLMISSVRNLWRSEARIRLGEVTELTENRWQHTGEIAHRAEPDLKNGRGGLRDVQLLRALALAQLTDAPTTGTPLDAANRRLLDVRTEVHRIAGRARDVVRAQDADEVAEALGVGDRFDLARLISDAGRTTVFAVDTGLRTAKRAAGPRGLARLNPRTALRGRTPLRRPLDEGVVEHGGEVALARDALPSQDPGLVLRVAAASARTGLPIAGATLDRLAKYGALPPEPWNGEDLADLLVLLSSGASVVGAIEALDRSGLWGRVFPEWAAVRDLPPRDGAHVWTVDRHLMETVAVAGELTTSVDRPDLLLLGALLHDIGKAPEVGVSAGDAERRTGESDPVVGYGHSERGAAVVPAIAARLGLWRDDAELLTEMVRHHLLLPAVAARRDLDDPAVIEEVADTLGRNPELVALLGALTEADSRATGPGVWGEWKASLIARLVEKVLAVIGGRPIPAVDDVPPALAELASTGEVRVLTERGDGPHTFVITMIAPDRPGLLSMMAGVLALADLNSRSAMVRNLGAVAVNSFVVNPDFGEPADTQLLRQRLVGVLDGRIDVTAALDKRARERAGSGVSGSGIRDLSPVPQAKVSWLDESARAGAEAVLQVRAADRPALLAKVAGVVEAHGGDVRWAHVETLGGTVVDIFGLKLPSDDPQHRRQLADAISRVAGPASG